jgi:hypothetical protein
MLGLVSDEKRLATSTLRPPPFNYKFLFKMFWLKGGGRSVEVARRLYAFLVVI